VPSGYPSDNRTTECNVGLETGGGWRGKGREGEREGGGKGGRGEGRWKGIEKEERRERNGEEGYLYFLNSVR
jgi:hypothetical protein